MNEALQQVLSAALSLPDRDRLELVEALAASLQPADKPPFDESRREVIRRRSTELRAGHVEPIPWLEVKRQAREQASG